MQSRYLEYYVAKEETTRETREAHLDIPNKKVITTAQICLRCRRTFPFRRGRKRCPHCQDILRTKVMIVKVP